MRIKFLSIIASFIMVSFLITSCLDDDNNIEYSPDATIHAFELDTIGYGIKYKFTIDQVGGLIYNEDSLPVHADTIIDRILIKTLSTSSGIVTMKDKSGEDSIINITDSIDLRKPVKLTVYAPDYSHKKEYTVSVRVHKHDPDSLMWKHMGAIQDEITRAQKTIKFGTGYLTYAKVGTSVKVYKSNGDLSNWTGGEEVTGLSELPNSILPLENEILATVNNVVYTSTEGVSWSASDKFNGIVVNSFISERPVGADANITYIKVENEKRYLCSVLASKLGDILHSEIKEEATANFPVDNISYTTFKKGDNYQNIIVGKHNPAITITVGKEEVPITVAWGYDGSTWAELGTTTSATAYCPKFENPTVVYYNKSFYIWGDKFESIYVSQNEGIAWKKANQKFSFPYQDWSDSGFAPSIEKPEFRGRENYSVIVEPSTAHIWVLFGSGTATFKEIVEKTEKARATEEKEHTYTYKSEVWRGRLNQLWFDIANGKYTY